MEPLRPAAGQNLARYTYITEELSLTTVFSQKHWLLALLLISSLPLTHSGQVGEENCQTKNCATGRQSLGQGMLLKACGCVGGPLPFGKLAIMNSNP